MIGYAKNGFPYIVWAVADRSSVAAIALSKKQVLPDRWQLYVSAQNPIFVCAQLAKIARTDSLLCTGGRKR